MMKKSLFVFYSIVILILVSPIKAAAYVPPAEQILKSLQSSNRGISTLTVELETTIYEDVYGMEVTGAEERLFIKKGFFLRLDRYRFSGKERIIQRGRKALAILSNEADSGVRIIDTVFPLLWFQSSLDDLVDILNFLGVDTATTSLDRIGKEVSYTIGTNDERKPGSRLWIERKRGVPLRFTGIVTSEGRKVTLRADYTDYIPLKKGAWFPGTIRIYKDDALWVESTTKKTEVNTDLPESLFYIPEGPHDGIPLTTFITIKE
jgi:outer membrane lipoprotein-sorting protein